LQTDRSEQAAERLADRPIVIDDDDSRLGLGLRHCIPLGGNRNSQPVIALAGSRHLD